MPVKYSDSSPHGEQGLSLNRIERRNLRVLVVRVADYVGRRHLLKYAALHGDEAVPTPTLNQEQFPAAQGMPHAVETDLQIAMKQLECFLLFHVPMTRMPLSGQHDDEFLAVFAVHQVDDQGAARAKLFRSVMVRHLDGEFVTDRNLRLVQHSLGLMDQAPQFVRQRPRASLGDG